MGFFMKTRRLQNKSGNNQLNINQAYETYGGYRQHSYMQRNFMQAVDKLTFSKNDQLKFLGFYSDLSYETPGGLTLAQFQANPQLARLPTKSIPGSIAAKSRYLSKNADLADL